MENSGKDDSRDKARKTMYEKVREREREGDVMADLTKSTSKND